MTVGKALEIMLELQDNLRWCSGSRDFGPGGEARQGWIKGPAETLKVSSEAINYLSRRITELQSIEARLAEKPGAVSAEDERALTVLKELQNLYGVGEEAFDEAVTYLRRRLSEKPDSGDRISDAEIKDYADDVTAGRNDVLQSMRALADCIYEKGIPAPPFDLKKRLAEITAETKKAADYIANGPKPTPPVVSPERIASLKSWLMYWGGWGSRPEKNGESEKAAVGNILTILSAYSKKSQIEKNTGMVESANGGVVPCKSGEAVADEEFQKMVTWLDNAPYFMGTLTPENYEMREKIIKALALAPAKTVSREWFDELTYRCWAYYQNAGDDPGTLDPKEILQMLRDLGIIVEPEKADEIETKEKK